MDRRKSLASTVKFDVSHPNALAIYCSDGRFTESVEQLLYGLGHGRLDTLTLPGGPALFNIWSASSSARQAMTEAARFLIEQHKIRRVILVAHKGCGYYKALCSGDAPQKIEERQRNDLALAARELRGPEGRVGTDLFYARVDGERVIFDPV
jgi:carbonic anhydrase